MDVRGILTIALLVGATALTGVGIWALTEMVTTARSVRRLSENMDARLNPLIEKADVSLDLLNAEMMRIDGIVTQVEEVSDRVSTTSEAVTDVVRAPMAFIVGFADRVRRARAQRAGSQAPMTRSEERTDG